MNHCQNPYQVLIRLIWTQKYHSELQLISSPRVVARVSSNVTVTELARLTIANVRRITKFVIPGVTRRVKCV